MHDSIDVRRAEVKSKLERLRALMRSRFLGAILLRRESSFAWSTAGGRSWIDVASSTGEASILVTHDAHVLMTNAIEAPRLWTEENLDALGFAFEVRPWAEPERMLTPRFAGLGSDRGGPGEIDLAEEIARMRSKLCPAEQERFRRSARDAAGAMSEVAATLEPGQSEEGVAAELARALLRRGITPTVLQVAFDERAVAFRHAPPTERVLVRHASISLCGRREGLVTSLSRTVHFGALPVELARREDAVVRVDAAMLHAARPGTSLGQVFRTAREAYEREGFAGEWEHHHQGGLAGYAPRERLLVEGDEERLAGGHAVAFNPTIAGTKSEDTALVTENGVELLTETDGWPETEVTIGSAKVRRPRIWAR
jgi:antitoxin VapB